MPVFRRGEIPHPPHGVGERRDEVYTQGGFFGDWAHLYRHRNPGIPKDWSDDALMYSAVETGAAEPGDARDPRGTPMTLLTGDGIRISLSKRAEPMPFCERNIDFHQIRFYHRGGSTLETELGTLETGPGDFAVIGKGLAYRERPHDADTAVVVFEVSEPIALGEALWDDVGYASFFIDYGEMHLPTPVDDGPGGETEVRVKRGDAYSSLVYDFDPCRDVVGWTGDPVIFRMNVRDVPGIGTSRGFLPPPAHAVLLSESKSFFFNVLNVAPFPAVPEPEGSYGAPTHLNDYEEVWLNHASEFRPDTEGDLWLFPRTVPHPGAKNPPRYPKNPPRPIRETKVNFDTRAELRWTEEAHAARLAGDPRVTVFTSLYGVPEEFLPEEAARYREQ